MKDNLLVWPCADFDMSPDPDVCVTVAMSAEWLARPEAMEITLKAIIDQDNRDRSRTLPDTSYD